MDTPLISILLAVYEPRMDWLKEQLISLNNQTYSRLRLYVRDDHSDKISFHDIRQLVDHCITAFPYEINQNDENIGSNKTFERMTAEADGEYFAYCDQDDIWSPQKITTLEEKVRNAVMAYSDMSVIDEKGNLIADSLKVIRPRIKYIEGKNLSEQYFFRNCTAGCSMLIRSDAAKRAIPFPYFTVCDQWLAMISAFEGRIAFTSEKLVAYRQHEDNQTGILTNIKTKTDYYRLKVEPLRERLEMYEAKREPSKDLKVFTEARLKKEIGKVWRYRHYSPYEAAIEIAANIMPEKLFEYLIKRSRSK